MNADRIVTQNLLHSAAAATQLTSPNVRGLPDLVALIDVFCLCDSVVAIGGRTALRIEDSRSDLVSLLLDTEFLRIQPVTGAEMATARTSARLHALSAFDSDGDAGRIADELNSETLDSFEGRALLYMGLSEVTGIDLVADSARRSIFGHVAEREREIRRRLLVTLQKAGYADAAGPPVLSRVSPLAGVVFDRASTLDEVPREMVALRSELYDLRARLREAEHSIRHGSGDARRKAERRWQLAVDEVGRAYGQEPWLVSLEVILAFGNSAGDFPDSATSAKGWLKFLSGLPAEAIRRWLLRRPLIELHRIRQSVPGPGRLELALARYYGCSRFEWDLGAGAVPEYGRAPRASS